MANVLVFGNVPPECAWEDYRSDGRLGAGLVWFRRAYRSAGPIGYGGHAGDQLYRAAGGYALVICFGYHACWS